jgi:hypothetical protein
MQPPLLRLVAPYLTPLDLLRCWVPAARSLRQLAEEAAPVVRVPAGELPALRLADGMRIQVEGGVCDATLCVNRTCRLSGTGTIRSLRIVKSRGRLHVTGLTVNHVLVSRGSVHLRQCTVNCTFSHGIVGSRCRLRLTECTLQNARTAHYNGIFARRCEVWLRQCSFTQCFAGVCLEDCCVGTLVDLHLRRCREGVVLQRCGQVRVERCHMNDVSSGVQLIDCAQAVVEKCDIQVHLSCTALLAQGSGAPSVRHCILGGKVVVLDGSHVMLHDNVLERGLRICRSNPCILDNRIQGPVVADTFGGVLAHNVMPCHTPPTMQRSLPSSSCYANKSLA